MGRTSRILSISAALMLTVAGSGCQQLAANVPKAVLVEYDQVLNFLDYSLQDGGVEFTNTDNGKTDHVSTVISAKNEPHKDGNINGVFLTFVICKIANIASEAEPFQYDVTKFYVIHAGKKYYAQVLEPYTLLYANGGGHVATPGVVDGIRKALRDETQVGADQELIPINQQVYPYFRFTIYLYHTGLFDVKVQPKLMYDSEHPHVMAPRNQPPTVLGDAKIAQLPTKCRPPAG